MKSILLFLLFLSISSLATAQDSIPEVKTTNWASWGKS
ncbi:hypothetical protein JCM19297_1717 [Nonlabens ulvanivorans]|nr:hypothetical protein JCM19297_1717 [Nonlabens ulvanivorans]